MRSDVKLWDDLTKSEAQAIFDEYVAGHPDRVRGAVAWLEDAGVDPAALDFSRASLEAIWPVVLRSAPPLPPAPEDEMSRDDLPYWAAFRLSHAQGIGRARVDLITLIAAYFAECVLRANPGNRWVIGDVKNHEGFRKPLLEFTGGARASTDDLVAKILVRALDDDDMYAQQDAMPSGLRRHFDLRMKIDPETPLDAWVAPTDGLESDVGGDDHDEHEVFEIDDLGDGSFHVTVNPEVDDELSLRVDALVDRLQSVDGIDRVHREDREVILIATSTKDHDALRDVLESQWQATA